MSTEPMILSGADFDRGRLRAGPLAAKRALDVGLCLVSLLVIWPVLLILAVLVKVSSPGPILFVQERTGKGGRPFNILKFRTMTHGPAGPDPRGWTRAEEARVTRLGSFLRAYGLDELPQILNILRGDMSIVGPRPSLPASAAAFSERQARMLLMKPGVLSLAAVKGRRGIPMQRRLDYHAEYVERWSLGLDFTILVQSLSVVFLRVNASDAVED